MYFAYTETETTVRNAEEQLISIKNVSKSFDGQEVLSNINLTIRRNEFITLLGPSGCGKTTLLRMIAGFEMPDSGEILFEGKSMKDVPPYKRKLNTVFQRYALFPHMNVYDNIAFGLKIKKLEKEQIDKKVTDMLRLVQLTGYEKRSITRLSGGQMQRVAIARALVNEPEVLLLDEPLGALDLKFRKEMQLELKRMQKQLGITFIYVTHDQDEALTMSDKVVVMSDGMIQQFGTPEEIYNEPNNAFVADFIGESNILNGEMTGKKKVMFCGAEFNCVDDVKKGTLVEVVVRPEDITIVSPDASPLTGEVISVIFKGMHYEITVLCGKTEIVIQSTRSARMNTEVGLLIEPDGIHIMKGEARVNKFDGVITKHNTVEFADGEFECDITQLYPGSYIDDKEYLITADGEKLDLTDVEVDVEVDVQDVRMSDNEDEGGVCGNIISLIYIGDHYNYVVRTENEEDFIVHDDILWNEDDYVAIVIPPEKIRLSLKETADE
ncbi:MAG: ABC transporter ATP-binding protein [Christensenellaceae bacterium]|nr:ABC transporter ATP-binding protein [Christensenellaceae bacterium]